MNAFPAKSNTSGSALSTPFGVQAVNVRAISKNLFMAFPDLGAFKGGDTEQGIFDRLFGVNRGDLRRSNPISLEVCDLNLVGELRVSNSPDVREHQPPGHCTRRIGVLHLSDDRRLVDPQMGQFGSGVGSVCEREFCEGVVCFVDGGRVDCAVGHSRKVFDGKVGTDEGVRPLGANHTPRRWVARQEHVQLIAGTGQQSDASKARG